MIRGLLLLLACQLVGELLKILSGIPVPGAVLGMLLMLALLILWPKAEEVSAPAADGLISILPVFFVAPTVGIFYLGEGFAGQWPALLAAGVLATLLCQALLAPIIRKSFPKADEH